MDNNSKNFAFWLLLILLIIFLFVSFNQPQQSNVETIGFSEFMTRVENKKVTSARIKGNILLGEYIDESGLKLKFKCLIPQADYDFVKDLFNRGVEGIQFENEQEDGFWSNFLFSWGPTLLFIGFLWFVFYKNMAGAGKGAFSFGKSRAKLFISNLPKVTFEDVSGCDEAKKELEEIIDFLKEPKKFQRLGGRIPKGVLVVGPPGTGKTLLARAVAGEAGVPFLSISGSDFVEMFVGVGASRVRDLFEQGKKNAPCIIFIDEIDAVGRQRGAGLGGGHDEREQTLNALLVEMDGFETNEGVILIAATNRPDVLDPALLRPGRFDRNVVVDKPDLAGRIGILKVHSRKIPLDINVDIEKVARGCPGFSGADLENLMNEAALLAARKNLDMVSNIELDEAKDKVLMGPARRSLVINDKEKKNTAYHEAGHALVAEMLPGTDPLHKITIIPRGRALGVTVHLPEEDKYSYPKDYWYNRIAILMGGRAAEDIVFGNPTTGAANDIERATEIARKMVCEWGMSDVIGPVQFGKKEQHPFLGRELSHNRDHSESTGIEIDREIKKIVTEQYEKAVKILEENRTILDKMSELLLQKETIEGAEVRAIIRGEEIVQPTHEEKTINEGLPVGVTDNDKTITFTISGMMFNSLEYQPLPEAIISLNNVGKIIEKRIEEKFKNPDKIVPRIEVIGYTDSLGEIEDNKVLSKKRAEVVLEYLANNFNIKRDYLSAIGKGEADPVDDNSSAEGRARNRRIKIIMLERKVSESANDVVMDGMITKIKEPNSKV